MKKLMTLTLIASLCLTGNAFAQDETESATVEADASAAYSVTVAERPLTITGGSLNADANLLFVGGFTADRFEIGAAYGIMDDLEVGLTLPLTFGMLDMPFTANDMTLGAVYRFMSGPIEMGASLDFNIPLATNFGVGLGVPVHIHAGILRIRTGLDLDLVFADATGIELMVPAGVDLAITDGLNLAVNTGFDLGDLQNVAWQVPLGIGVGYTFGSEGPVADIQAVFEMPSFASDAGVNADNYTVGLKSRIYIL